MTENLFKRTINSDIIVAYLIGTAIAVMGLFTIIAIKSGGVFEIDMTAYGEYEIEIMILISWFVLLILRISKVSIMTDNKEEK